MTVRLPWHSATLLVRSCTAALALTLVACSSGGGSGDPNILLDPSQFSETAPETFVARFDTSQGVFRVEVERAWAPRGADRFFNLVRNGFYDQVRFFRIVPGFVVQFGLNGDPAVSAVWTQQRMDDDPVTQSNLTGFLSFATAGADTRTTQLFINLANNSQLDAQGFSPFGRVIEGMDVVGMLFSGYGEQPSQSRILTEGNPYLEAEFPDLDFVIEAVIEPADGAD